MARPGAELKALRPQARRFNSWHMGDRLPPPENNEERRARIRDAGLRALAEAAVRQSPAPALPREQGGAAGPEPTRYGDWERKGIATDF